VLNKSHLKLLRNFTDFGLVRFTVSDGSIRLEGARFTYAKMGQTGGTSVSAIVDVGAIADAIGTLGSSETITLRNSSVRIEGAAGYVDVPVVRSEIVTMSDFDYGEVEWSDGDDLRKLALFHKITPANIDFHAYFIASRRIVLTDGYVLDFADTKLDGEIALSMNFIEHAKALFGAANELEAAIVDDGLLVKAKLDDNAEATVLIPRVSAKIPPVGQIIETATKAQTLATFEPSKAAKVVRYIASRRPELVELRADSEETRIWAVKDGHEMQIGIGGSGDGTLPLPQYIYQSLVRKGAKSGEVRTIEHKPGAVMVVVADNTGVNFVSAVNVGG